MSQFLVIEFRSKESIDSYVDTLNDATGMDAYPRLTDSLDARKMKIGENTYILRREKDRDD